MESYKSYVNDSQETCLPKISEESSINTVSPRLALGVCVANTFGAALLDTPELQFISSSGLSDLQYTRQHARKVIAFNKEFDIFPGQYWLDSLSPLVFCTKDVNEVTHRYFRLPLE